MAFLFNNNKSKLKTVDGTNPLIKLQKQNYTYVREDGFPADTELNVIIEQSELEDVDLTNYSIIGLCGCRFTNVSTQKVFVKGFKAQENFIVLQLYNFGTSPLQVIPMELSLITIKK